MSIESLVIVALWIVSILLLTVLGRTDRPRESLFIFVLAQTISWPSTILAVLFGLMESPVRLFPKATDSNFMIAFVFFPSVTVACYWHFPRNRSRLLQLGYSFAVAAFIALAHVALQKYTDLVRYISFSGYKAWLFSVVTNYIIRIYSDWYFRQLAKSRVGKL